MSALRNLYLSAVLAACAACLLGSAAPRAARAESAAADAWAATARAAAQANQHEQAIQAFEYAIQEDPSRRSALLREYADQLTYGGRGDDAIPLYRELLAANALSADEQTRARRGLALALSWADQQQPALREYQALVAQNPADLDALRSVARVQSWQGRHRRAVEQLEAFLAEHPHDSEGVAMLAQTLDWMGRPDRAKALLRDQLAAMPGDANARRLLDQLERDERPETFFDYSESHQSDELRISGWGVRQDFTFNDGLTTVGPRFHTYVYDPQHQVANGSGTPISSNDVFVYRPGLRARHRLNDAFEWNGIGGVDVIDAPHGSDTAPFIYDTWLTYWASDLLRFDVGSSRSTFDNVLSLRESITAKFATASFDVTPDEKTRFTGRFRWGDYDKRDEQTWWQAEAERRIWNDPRTYLALRYTGMDFKRQADKYYNGYFNPSHYHSGEARLRAYDELFPDFWYHFEASAGVEDQRNDEAKFLWSAAGGVSYWFTDWLELALQYGYFSSKTAASGGSSGGFDRGTGSLTLRTRW